MILAWLVFHQLNNYFKLTLSCKLIKIIIYRRSFLILCYDSYQLEHGEQRRTPKHLVSNNSSALIDRVKFVNVQKKFACRRSMHKKLFGSVAEQGKHSRKYALLELLMFRECDIAC